MTASRIGMRALGLMAGVVVCAASMGTGCSDARADEVYVRFFHAYPGSPSISVFSSQGGLVRNLAFNEYSDVIAIDRGLFNGQFQLLADGVPFTGILQGQEVFSMYNGETATIMITSRSQQQQFSSLFLRHNLVTPGTGGLFGLDNYDCAIEIHNGLAVGSGQSNNFAFSVQRRATDDERETTYDAQRDDVVLTECGSINLNDSEFPELGGLYANGQAISTTRAGIRDEIERDPWFWPVEITSDSPQAGRQNRLTYVAGVWLDDSSLSSVRPSIEYQECLSSAITIAQDEMAAGGMASESPCEFGPSGPQVPVENGKYRLEVDQTEVDRCVRGLDNYTLIRFLPVEGNASTSTVLYSYTTPERQSCQAEYRLRTAAMDFIFDPNTTTNDAGSGRHVTLTYQSAKSTYQYLVVYGLPLNPLVEFFNATDEGQASDFFDDTRYPVPGRLEPDSSTRVNTGN